ncbi:MAG: 50S ribosomal protein L20 [Azospirillum brasilense]|nr:MAG: 50S ribosomal protein L20 [Azospirillum brasilense]
MAHVKRGVTKRARHRKIMKLAKGFRGRAGTCYRVAINRVEHGLQYAYRDRRNKKRTFRALWIQRINAAAREHGLVYSQFMNGLNKAGITLDRKVLADIAVKDAAMFKQLADQASKALKA